jgi:Zn-dependent protease with chaperone function
MSQSLSMATQRTGATAPEPVLLAWSPGERESFFAAIERHRRASWRVTLACGLVMVALAFVMAVLLSPLLVCIAGLLLDLANLIVPLPDLLGAAGRVVEPLADDKMFSLALLLKLSLIASVPGLALMSVAIGMLHRLLRQSPLFAGGDVPGRAPDRNVLAEQRLANVVEEMALAAAIPVPRVCIVPGGTNAAAFGRDEHHVTIVVAEGLLSTLDREQLQGALAHLIAAIAGGDMAIGLRMATTMALFGLLARLSTGFADRAALRANVRLLMTLTWPTRGGAARAIEQLSDPYGDPGGDDRATEPPPVARPRETYKLTWREWALMPFYGPIVLSGFVSGLVGLFLLGPLVALAWRTRKYMADAAAVRLTRHPDSIAAALTAIAAHRGVNLRAWASHLGIVDAKSADRGLLGGSIVSMFPSIDKRLKALNLMGAQAAPTRSSWRLPAPLLALTIGLLSVAGALGALAAFLLVMVSVAMSMLFTAFPAAILHALLRAIGN